MNIFAHTIIANSTFDLLEQDYGLVLNRRQFVLGNLIPDLSPKFKRPVHRYKNWAPIVFNMIDSASEDDMSVNQLSLQLGCVSHFLSDFFCLAHTEDLYRGQIEHLDYETRQYNAFRQIVGKKSDFTPVFESIRGSKLTSYIESNHHSFKEIGFDKISFEDELRNSVSVCASVCACVADNKVRVPSFARVVAGF